MLRFCYWSCILCCQSKIISYGYGRSLIGERAVVKKVVQNQGGRVTAIPVICTEELLDVGLHEGTVDAATFQEFMTEKLCPNLLSFNGANPRSVVIQVIEICKLEIMFQFLYDVEVLFNAQLHEQLQIQFCDCSLKSPFFEKWL